MPLAETAVTAGAAFAATNVDDIVLLSVLFARRDDRLRTRHIVAGQYVGVAIIVAASLVISFGLLALPDEAVGVLGFVPIVLGLRGLWRVRRPDPGIDDQGDPAAMTTTGVAAVTVANGADNIAVYAPLLATLEAGGVTVTLIVFFGLIAVWCLAGLLIGTRPAVIRAVGWAGDYAIPVVLMALGVFILAESGLPQTLLG